MSLPRVMIGMPVGSGSVPWPTAMSLMNSVRVCDREKIPVRISASVGCSVVQWARNAVVAEFLKSDATHLFWIDSDIVWTPNDFIRLAAFGAAYDVIGATYPFKSDPPTCLLNTPGAEDEYEINGHGNVRVSSLGLGFTLVKRDVIVRLAETKPTVNDPLNGITGPDMFAVGRRPDGTAYGEDIKFFDDVHDLGYAVWLDPSINLGHVGQKIYQGSVIDMLGLQDLAKEK